jgi:hypothetical protein
LDGTANGTDDGSLDFDGTTNDNVEGLLDPDGLPLTVLLGCYQLRQAQQLTGLRWYSRKNIQWLLA